MRLASRSRDIAVALARDQDRQGQEERQTTQGCAVLVPARLARAERSELRPSSWGC